MDAGRRRAVELALDGSLEPDPVQHPHHQEPDPRARGRGGRPGPPVPRGRDRDAHGRAPAERARPGAVRVARRAGAPIPRDRRRHAAGPLRRGGRGARAGRAGDPVLHPGQPGRGRARAREGGPGRVGARARARARVARVHLSGPRGGVSHPGPRGGTSRAGHGADLDALSRLRLHARASRAHDGGLALSGVRHDRLRAARAASPIREDALPAPPPGGGRLATGRALRGAARRRRAPHARPRAREPIPARPELPCGRGGHRGHLRRRFVPRWRSPSPPREVLSRAPSS